MYLIHKITPLAGASSPARPALQRQCLISWLGGVLLVLATFLEFQAEATIQHVSNGFLFTGTNSFNVLISDANGAILSVTAGSGIVASGGESGLWSLAYTNSSLNTNGTISAAAFSSTSSSNTFQWTQPASDSLLLTYSNVDVTVAVTLSNRNDGVDISAVVTPALKTVLGLTLPARLRFAPAAMQRFIAPSHSSDGVGAAYNPSFFQVQPEGSPASWAEVSKGDAGYYQLYTGMNFVGSSASVPISFTTNAVNWLGAGVTNTWANTNAIVNRAPTLRPTDVVLIDSTNGAFFSGSHLDGGTNAGWLMRIGGLVDTARIPLSLDVVIGAIEHLAQTPATGRTKVAILDLERGPVIGYNWPSAVTVDAWLARLRGSSVLASNGIEIVELSNAQAMMDALAATNYLAILNPYGELTPSPLTNDFVNTTVASIGNFVRAGGNWFEVGGIPFFNALLPVLYYTNSIPYPPAFADFQQLETTNGNAALFGVQPVSADPWSTNPANLFVPGQVAWGADTNGGYFERGFNTYVAANQTWQSPVIRLALGHAVADSVQAYCQANQFNRGLTNKMSSTTLAKFKQSVLINYLVDGAVPVGVCTQLTAHLSQLPTPALVHFAQYLYGGFDKQYPDHLPPNASFGTTAEFTNFLGQAKSLGLLTMPYSNPTFWGIDPAGPTFLAAGAAALVTNLDGTLSLENYFGNSGYTACPWSPFVKTANLNTLGQFMTNYPVDVLFEDQVGARTWQYDLNAASPTPYAYMAGNAARAAEDSQSMPISTENGYDRLVNYESQFCGLAWGIVPTTNAPSWRRFLTERYLPATWQIFPLAQYIAHDKLAMNYNDLNAPVTTDETVAWTLGLGYGMTYHLNAADLDQAATRQWLLWIDRLQKSVCARYIGQPANSFSHQWGTNLLNPAHGVISTGTASVPNNGVIQASYGPVSVIANLNPLPLATNGYLLPSYGFIATSPGMFAANMIVAGGSNAVSSVAETNASGGIDYWIYSTGGGTVTIPLPSGFNSQATVQLDGCSTNQTQIQSNTLTVLLCGSAGYQLWHGTIVPNSLPAILVDFGNNNSFRGASVVNPDSNGNYWNSVWSGGYNPGLVDINNASTSLGLGFDFATGTDFYNGPAGAVQNPAACSNVVNALKLNPSGALLAINEAVYDYYVSAKFEIQGLATNRAYRLTFFGSHIFSTDDSTVYSICADTNYGAAVASASLNVQTPGAAGLCNSNQVAVIGNLVPQTNGVLYVKFLGAGGNAGYLNAMMIETALLPSPTNLTAWLSGTSVGLSWSWNGSGQSGFVIQRRLSGTGTWADLATVGVSATNYTDASAVIGAVYDYQVAALQSGGQRGFYSSAATIALANTVVVHGSSVAKGVGSSSASETNGSWVNGYAGLLTQILATSGPTVTNVSLPGDWSGGAVSRFPTVVVPSAPRYVLIGYSLGNDGLAGTTDPQSATIVSNFLANIWNVVGQCRSNGFYPVVAGVYTRNDYTANNYAYVKATQLAINAWDVPSLNFLGTIDDGTGHWINGYWNDALHPNDAGHREMFYSLVPSLFDAIAVGKTNSPQFGSATNFARLKYNAGVNAPVTFSPSNTVHSFTMSFRVRSTANGTVAAVRSGTNYGTLEIRSNQVVYVSTNGQEIAISVSATNGAWHDVALACRYALTNTALIVDGTLAGTLTEQIVPDQFILGGPGATSRPATPLAADFQNWCVYRSAWNTNDAVAHMQGNLQQASMEIGAMLDDASFASGVSVTNRAQSLSVARVNTTNFAAVHGVPSPTGLTAQSLSGTAAKLTWTWSGSGQTGFVIQRRQTGTSTWSDIATVAAVSITYTNTGLAQSSSYDYRVAAAELGGLRGNYGNIATVITPGSTAHPTVLIDFGPNDVTNGDSTGSPDYLGQYWNNLIGAGGGGILPSLGLANMVTTNNLTTTIGLVTSNGGWSANGKLNGGLLAPSYALLGNLAVTNATEDYFFTQTSATLILTNLDAAANYRLRYFATRNIASSRVTRYITTGGNGSFTNDQATSGAGIGSGGYDGNNNTIVSLSSVTPDASNQIQVGVIAQTGGFGYLGIMEITANHPPVAGSDNYTRLAGASLTITNTDLLANDKDPDGDALTLVGFGSLPAGATTNGTNTFTLSGTNTTVNFSYTVSDGFGLVTGFVSVAVLNGFVAGQPITGQFATNSANGSFTINYYGLMGYTYSLQRTTNLSDPNSWVNLTTNVFGASGITNVVDGNPPHSVAFYRVKWLQP